ncbi:hypothetical protein T484DRAFT_1910747 [Baffinella frigidus]|nr:hypothetical protein T484DRAFT_1910747 [Cryptophyta sp. CCMP2293]
MVCGTARRSRPGTVCGRRTGLLTVVAAVACLSARFTLALPRDGSARRGLLPAANQGARLGLMAHGVAGRGMVVRLRGGVADSEPETESEEERGPAQKLSAPSRPTPAAASKPAPAPAAKASAAKAAPSATTAEEAAVATEGGGDGEEAAAMSTSGEAATGEEGVQGEGGEAADGLNATRPPLTPEMVQKLNERLWEAAAEGNEPMIQKALDGGACVNAYCRGPDKWVNISMGEIAGADEAHCGLNAQWMELNNFTAIHLAAAAGNAGIIDMLVEKGADFNAECLQRMHPFPSLMGLSVPFASQPVPIIYKCTPLRLARAAASGRCFFSAYQKSVEKLENYGAADRDFHYPLNTMILGMAFGGAYLGLKKWPFAWFTEWPFNWADYPDMAKYTK